MAEQLNTTSTTGITTTTDTTTGGATKLAERPFQVGPTTSAVTSPAAGTKPIPFAAVSFVCGLVGLLVANLVLGPLAIVLGAVGLRADRNRRVRATLGILLGVADIAVFLYLAAHSGAHHGSLNWNFFSN
ncbi:MAG TPA: hypothetical protein VFN97_23070 [Actinospica sp.]|nr:hypothetical protein [Actinospica sp.]